ncbi:hypothetical protein GE061_006621 [Apolygus lucorum]|uniref:CCHC-type domain-containing protein n=1 Tax=Apolygus lucorum TaxID=248454 RepID=A0A8S9WW35_APOLU|nr:hypothetical protein GE061_006621 [Apolygus lucorum]
MERRNTKSRVGSPSMGSPGGSCNPHAPKSAIQRLSQASTALGELSAYITREFSSAKHAKYLSMRVDLIETVHRELEDDLGLMGKIYPRLVSLETSVAHIVGCLEGLGSAGQAEAGQMDMGAIQQCVQTIVRKEVQAVQATLEAVDSRDEGEERRLLSKLTEKCDDMVEAVTGTIAGKLSPISKRPMVIPPSTLDCLVDQFASRMDEVAKEWADAVSKSVQEALNRNLVREEPALASALSHSTGESGPREKSAPTLPSNKGKATFSEMLQGPGRVITTPVASQKRRNKGETKKGTPSPPRGHGIDGKANTREPAKNAAGPSVAKGRGGVDDKTPTAEPKQRKRGKGGKTAKLPTGPRTEDTRGLPRTAGAPKDNSGDRQGQIVQANPRDSAAGWQQVSYKKGKSGSLPAPSRVRHALPVKRIIEEGMRVADRLRGNFDITVTAAEGMESPRTHLTQCLDPEKGKIKVRRIRNVDPHTFVVSVASESDAEALMQSTAVVMAGFTAQRGAASRCPRVVVRGVEKCISAEDLPVAIWRRNGDLFAGLADGALPSDCIRVCHRLGSGNSPLTAWVLAVTPAVRKTMVDASSIFIGLRECRVTDHITATQCTKCYGFGHPTRVCSAKIACRQCGNRGHLTSGCPNKSKGQKCVNCAAAGRIDRAHRPDDQSRCVEWELAKIKVASLTEYGSPGGVATLKPASVRLTLGPGAPKGARPQEANKPQSEGGAKPKGPKPKPGPQANSGDGGGAKQGKVDDSKKEETPCKDPPTDEPISGPKSDGTPDGGEGTSLEGPNPKEGNADELTKNTQDIDPSSEARDASAGHS